ncbi:MAG: Quinolinate synthase A [Alphaproteobacteria bacterium MarineAlpha8_Bin1]|nr:MAG: Quinolinate synthase A [Alphaproteobacteria bacterium MarineAlpha8_Bin1]|tara:strand:- start:2290 stop:3234 length:945 start_codon:yes stop_codon:yes gene_type:complete
MKNLKKNFKTLEEEIDFLKKRENAIILAHFYQDEDIQDIADFIGDSLDLSRKAQNAKADVIVFCGVRFMAEVAKILSPSKKVLLPDINAGCSLEESCRAKDFKKFKDQNKDHLVLSYINCSAEIKALSDIIVTSSNAEKIINSLPKNQKIIFAPDKHLGGYLNKKTGRNMLLWQGTCIVHETFSEKELIKMKVRNDDAKIIAHPECPENILNHSNYVGSTSALLKFISKDKSKKFIVATEPHILHQMKKNEPRKTFLIAPGIDGSCSCSNCPYMELNTLEKLRDCLYNLSPQITIDNELILKAKKPLNTMLKLS